mmetsp:Transcript_7173/g.32383  ORF Transcript_7173/g.32383 Transcript_7173/m.32383 type:complete len:233 (+) Transcript_7173:176-874(+)
MPPLSVAVELAQEPHAPNIRTATIPSSIPTTSTSPPSAARNGRTSSRASSTLATVSSFNGRSGSSASSSSSSSPPFSGSCSCSAEATWGLATATARAASFGAAVTARPSVCIAARRSLGSDVAPEDPDSLPAHHPTASARSLRPAPVPATRLSSVVSASPAARRHAASSSAPSLATMGTNRKVACASTASAGNRATTSRRQFMALSLPDACWYSRLAANASRCCCSLRSPSG